MPIMRCLDNKYSSLYCDRFRTFINSTSPIFDSYWGKMRGIVGRISERNEGRTKMAI